MVGNIPVPGAFVIPLVEFKFTNKFRLAVVRYIMVCDCPDVNILVTICTGEQSLQVNVIVLIMCIEKYRPVAKSVSWSIGRDGIVGFPKNCPI